jgi:hypothetical protein
MKNRSHVRLLKRNLAEIAVLGFLLLPMAAFSDGTVFVERRVESLVLIPDQRALIHFENGIQRQHFCPD